MFCLHRNDKVFHPLAFCVSHFKTDHISSEFQTDTDFENTSNVFTILRTEQKHSFCEQPITKWHIYQGGQQNGFGTEDSRKEKKNYAQNGEKELKLYLFYYVVWIFTWNFSSMEGTVTDRREIQYFRRCNSVVFVVCPAKRNSIQPVPKIIVICCFSLFIREIF